MALFTETTKEAAIKKAGIARATGYKYANDPIFKQHYMEMKRRLMEQTTQTIQQASNKAAKALIGVLDDEDASVSERTRAASIILDNAYKAQELDDITARIEQLERSLEEGG